MKNNIKVSRVIVNILFCIFYILLTSVIFSFVFPFILKVFGQPILNPSDPIFDKIQIAIIVIVLVISLIFRRYFYLPIIKGDLLDVNKNTKKELELEHDMNVAKKMREKEGSHSASLKKIESDVGEVKDELDIKVGREVK